VGITADFLAATKHSAAQLRLNAGYCDAVVNAGGMPVILPPFDKDSPLNDLLDRLDGVLFSGGFDLDPRRYGLPAHQAVRPIAERREASDRRLVREVLDRRMPLLAIGLGMQQVNMACGGTLYLHLPEDLPRALPHLDLEEGPHRHAVLLEPNTRIDEIYGGGEIRVNSAHHQAVRQVGEGLRVGAVAPDGVIEAIESTNPNWFCVGVQWHPESDSASALDAQLFECFIQACLRHESMSLAA
jgi:putative glutamine amidotransferase